MKIVVFLLLLASAALTAANSNLPLEHWAYPFLLRLEAKGLISGYELRVRPLPRQVIADFIQQALSNAARLPLSVSKSDWALLEQLQSDFSQELAVKPTVDRKIRPEPHLYTLQEEGVTLHFDLIARQAVISNRGDSYAPDQLLSETTGGGQLRGAIGNSISFFAEVRNAMTRGEDRDKEDESFDPSKGLPVGASGKNVYRDRATAYFVWDKSRLRLEAGKDEFDWGPFLNQGLAVSSNAPPADLFRLSWRMQRLKFTFLHAWLSSSLGQKYLAAHRLDFALGHGIYLGLGETVVYADRNPEPSYLNPLMLYHVAEHHLGDLDNNNLFLDATLTAVPNLTINAEWYIDDMTLTKNLRNYFGNKFGWSVGALWADAFTLQNLDINIKYSKISPFVYTHWDSINIYTHYDKLIGGGPGPNADVASLSLARQFGRNFRAEVFYRAERRGQGAADTNTRPPTGDAKNFLRGVIERRSIAGFRLVDQVYRDLYVSIHYQYEDTRNWGLNLGRINVDHLVRIQADLNF